MHITRRTEARRYDARNHHGMVAFRLQGQEASPAETLWVGLSLFLPGGGADRSASPTEKVYVVLDGEITVLFDDEVATLAAGDSILIAAGEARAVENRTNDLCRMLVISPR